MKVEVLVVGAGPAGSCAAREIAEAGFEVLALDRRAEIGYPVQCGEFLPTPEELRKIFPQSEEYGDLFDTEPEIVERETNEIEINGPRGLKYSLNFQGMTIDRRRFDKSLWQRAEKAGARLMTGVEFLRLSSSNCAETTAGEIEFKLLVGADGPLSKIRKSLGLEGPKAISQAITTQTRGEWDNLVRMYFGSIAPGGYAWIIPKRGGANIGLGIQRKFVKGSLSTLLQRFLEENRISSGETTYGQVPISGPIPRTTKGNAILVGDAAGQVMATNGGGIPIAMICGRICGRCIAGTLRGSGALSDYEREWRRQLLTPLRNAARTKAIADLFFPTDRRLKFAMNVLGSGGIERAILCKRLFHLL